MRRLSEVLKKIRWTPPTKSKILLCPRCRSRNIGLSSKFDLWLMPKRYVCGNCGYIGPLILEVDEEEYREASRED